MEGRDIAGKEERQVGSLFGRKFGEEARYSAERCGEPRGGDRLVGIEFGGLGYGRD